MKDFLESRGNVKLYGSKDATREAFKHELIQNGDVWMDMIKSRNLTSHTYNDQVANDIFLKILRAYYPLFTQFRDKMGQLAGQDERGIFAEEV